MIELALGRDTPIDLCSGSTRRYGPAAPTALPCDTVYRFPPR